MPEGAYVSDTWLDSQATWLKLNKEESINGKIVLESTAGDMISPDNTIPLNLEVHYLDQKIEHKELHDLILEEVK